MAVPADAVALASDDEHGLGVRLEPDDAVHDVDARLLERSRPVDVRLLVDARGELDERDDLLAGCRGTHQRANDRSFTFAGRPVNRLLDGEDIRIVRRLVDERLDRGREPVVGVVNEHVAARGAHRECHGARRAAARAAAA